MASVRYLFYVYQKPGSLFALFLFCLMFLQIPASYADAALSLHHESNRSSYDWRLLPSTVSLSEIDSDILSAEAVQLAEQLNLTDKLRRLHYLQGLLKEQGKSRLSSDLKDELRDLKEEIVEAVFQTRLEIDYACSELFLEHVVYIAQVRVYTHNRENRVNNSNTWAFRSNGVLWAIAEALAIPTYNHPKLSIPSGIIGIPAGIVPTAFSMLAQHQSSGGNFETKPSPNMLSKVFGYPTAPYNEYPRSVWTYLNSTLAGKKDGQTRMEMLISHWLKSPAIRTFTSINSRKELGLLTSNGPQNLSIDILSDREEMVSQLEALIGLMRRPLLELMMAVRGSKHLPPES